MNKTGFSYAAWTLSLILLALLPACDWFKKKGGEQPTARATNKALKIVSVNDEDVYKDAHIKGDIRIPYEKITNLEQVTEGWDKNTPVVVYCTDYACTASKTFAKALMEHGFTNVAAYEGGIAEWYQLNLKDKSYPFEGPAQESYLKTPIDKEKTENKDTDVPVITAQELHMRMKEAGLIE